MPLVFVSTTNEAGHMLRTPAV